MEVYDNTKKLPVARWILAVVLLLCFCGLLFAVKTGYAAYFDEPTRNFLYGLRADWLTAFFRGVTFIANPMTLIVMCGILIVCPWTTLRFGIPVAIATGLGSLVHQGLKILILRERPDAVLHLVEETSYGFPSGHANASLIFFVVLAFLIRRGLNAKKHNDLANLFTVIFVIIIILIGISRVYLGVHYPTDVLGGWCVGGILSIVFISLYDAIYPDRYHLGINAQDTGWASPDKGKWVRPQKPKAKDE